MMRLTLALVLAAAAGPAAALDLPPLCQALHGLADAARETGQPQRLSVSANGCAPGAESGAARAFCAASGAGDPDAFAWDLMRSCLNSLGTETQVTTGAEGDVGPRHRKRISHMTARLGHGVRLDLAYGAGRYDLILWSPRELTSKERPR